MNALLVLSSVVLLGLDDPEAPPPEPAPAEVQAPVEAAPPAPAPTPDPAVEAAAAPKAVVPWLPPTRAPVLDPPAPAYGSRSVYRVDLPVEASVTVGSVGLFVLIDLMIKPSLEGDISCRRPIGNGKCDPMDLNPLDRYSVGRESAPWQTFGDIALVSGMVLPILYVAAETVIQPSDSPWKDFATDSIVVAEAISLTGAMNTVFKFAFRRPRPIRYSDIDVPLPIFDSEISVPSGHTALVAAGTTALSTTFWLRHPDSPARFVVLGSGIVLTALTGFSRIEAGQHFFTDVMVGVLLGGFAGFAVPYFHRKDLGLMPVIAFQPTTGQSHFGVSGQF